MDCHDYRENLTAYLQGELPFKQVMELHAHLGRCEDCAREERELRQTLFLFGKFYPEMLPGDFDQQLNLRLAQLKPIAPRQQWPFRRVIFTIAATLLITFGIEFLAYQIFQESRAQDTLISLANTTQTYQAEKYFRSSRSGSEADYLKKYSSFYQKFSRRADNSTGFRIETLRKN